jgi:hypothetical protein
MRGILHLGLTCVLAKLAHLDGRNTALTVAAVGVHGSDDSFGYFGALGVQVVLSLKKQSIL